MIIAILILNVITLIFILGINESVKSLVDRTAELGIDVEGTKEKLDEIFSDKETTEYDA